MPAPIAIPLIAASPQLGAAIIAGGAAIGTYIAGQAFKKSYETGQISAPSILKPNSSPQQFTEASANYLRAYSEYESNRGKAFSNLQTDKDVATEIAKNYDWVAVDEASGKLAILADRDLAAGGHLNVSVNTDKLIVSNDTVFKNIPFENYGTDKLPLAVTQETAFNVTLSEDGTLPLIIEQEVTLNNLQYVAQTAIEYERINFDSTFPAAILPDQREFDLPPQVDVVTPELTNTVPVADVNMAEPIAAANQDLGIPSVQSFGEDVINPAFTPEQAARTASYLEDTPLVGVPEAISTSAGFENARALEIAAANSLGTTPGVELPPPLARSNFNSETQSVINPRAISQETAKINTSAGSKPVPKERPNPLHAYANWTYKITWYALSKEKANIVSSGRLNPGGEGALTEGATVIMSSGGLKQHSSDFPNDMYFGSLTIESIVGVGNQSRGVDGIYFQMEVIEPYNITLIPRLVTANNSLNGNKDWGLGFYLLKVEFIGYDDQGEPKIVPNTTKWFPFNINDFNFKVGPKHTSYNIKGTPYHHVSQSPLDNTIPFHMEIVGGTVEEIFNASKATAGSAATGTRGGGVRDSSIATTDGVTGGNAGGPLVKGVSVALNENEDFIKKAYPRKEKNKYSFEFKDGIGASKVTDAVTYQTSAFAMSNPKKLDRYLDKTKNTFRIQNGTKISDLINIILQMSDYYINQFKPGGSSNDPIIAHKIIPQVKFGNYDCVTKTWQREVTFVVKKHIIYGNDIEGFGKKAPPGYCKSYKWLFTGQNKDVIDVNIDYKVAFFDVKNANEKIKVLSKDGSSNVRNNDIPNNEPCVIPELPVRSILVSGIASQSNTGAKDRNVATLSLEELFHRQFDSEGDNIQLNLTIIGDPDLLQQDNLLYNTNVDNGQIFIPNSSINFQDFEVYFNFEFKSPMKDYDDSTGLFQVNDASTNSFNGLYKVVKVKSEFRNGKFTQQIENYRVRTQSNANDQARTSGDSARSGFRQGGTDTVAENPTYSVREGDSNPFDVAGGDTVVRSGDSNPFDVAGGTTIDAANAAQNAAPDLTQELINNNPGDPNVPTSTFG